MRDDVGAKMTKTLFSASAVAIDGLALAIEGPPGSGKSSLALALIDRGAMLIGDDGVELTRHGDRIIASPPPNIAGLIELRGVGLFEMPIADPAPLALIVSLGPYPEGFEPERLPETLPQQQFHGLNIPRLAFQPGTIAPAMRAQMALAKHGLQF